YRTVTIQAGKHTLTAAEPPPPDLAEILANIHSLRAH
ncbi:putative transposase domain protein, partial [Mycobacterium sp. MAC_011194_8550]